MKIRQIGLLAGILFVLTVSPNVYAQETKSPAKLDWKAKGERLFAQLNLTEEQKTQIKANKQAQHAQMKASFEQMKAQREAMKQELMKPQLDIAKINTIQAQIKAGMAQMADARLNSILEVRKILSPEQFSRFLSIMSERHKGIEGKMGKGHFADD